MLKLNENYEVDRRILKCDFIPDLPSETTIIYTANSQIYINTAREDSVISLMNKYLEKIFELVKKGDKTDMQMATA